MLLVALCILLEQSPSLVLYFNIVIIIPLIEEYIYIFIFTSSYSSV